MSVQRRHAWLRKWLLCWVQDFVLSEKLHHHLHHHHLNASARTFLKMYPSIRKMTTTCMTPSHQRGMKITYLNIMTTRLREAMDIRRRRRKNLRMKRKRKRTVRRRRKAQMSIPMKIGIISTPQREMKKLHLTELGKPTGSGGFLQKVTLAIESQQIGMSWNMRDGNIVSRVTQRSGGTNRENNRATWKPR
jgi:hypothetical protein